MNAKRLGWGLLLFAFCALHAHTGEPTPPALPALEGASVAQPADKKDQPKQPAKEKDKKPEEKKLTDAPDTDAFTRTPAPIRDALGFNPQMLGDLGFLVARANVTLAGTQTTTTTTTIQQFNPPPGRTIVLAPTTTTTPFVGQRTVLVPIPNLGAFKVAENASPMPIDRVFFTYNYFNAIRSAQSDPANTVSTQTSVLRLRTGNVTTDVTTSTVLPGTPLVNLHREVFGFEKTFLDGRASVEFRLPIFQQTSSLDDFRSSIFGDITVIGKYAMFLDRDAGNVLSGGLAVTAPTSPSIQTINGTFHSTLLQPWLGYIWNFDRAYVHAFHSVVVPTDTRDVTLLFNDAGVGYWLYRGQGDRPLRFVVPTAEVHVTTPLSNRSANDPITVFDTVVMTGGLHVGLFRGSVLTLGVGTPINGPRLYGVEAYVQYNRRF